MKTTRASAILQVNDLNKSISFYCEVLRFTKEFAYGDPPFYAGVRHDDVILHLCSSEENKMRRGMGSVYIFCDEVDAYHTEILSRGAKVTSPLSTYPYGMRDFQIKDIDGNLISFGTPVGDEKD